MLALLVPGVGMGGSAVEADPDYFLRRVIVYDFRRTTITYDPTRDTITYDSTRPTIEYEGQP